MQFISLVDKMAQKSASKNLTKNVFCDDELANVMSQLRIEGSSKDPPFNAGAMMPQDQFRHKDITREETNLDEGLNVFSGDSWDEVEKWKGFRPSKVNLTEDGIRQFSFKNPHFDGKEKTLTDQEMTAVCNEFLVMNKRKKNEHAIKSATTNRPMQSETRDAAVGSTHTVRVTRSSEEHFKNQHILLT